MYKIDEEGKILTYFVEGRMDTVAVRKIEALFCELLADDFSVMLDMEHCEYISSAFIRFIMCTVKRVGIDNMKIKNTEYPPVKKILDMLKIGFGWLPDGTLVYVERNHNARRLMIYHNKKSEVYCDLSDFTDFQFNELTVDSKGRIYISNTGNTMKDFRNIDFDAKAPIVLIQDGQIEIVAEDLSFLNGMAISGDNKTFVMSETFASKVTAFDIEENGKLSNRRTFAEFQSDIKPDGIFLDHYNAAWIASANSFCIRVEEGGKITHVINTESEKCLGCMMGPDNTIYMCTKGNVQFDLTQNRFPKTGKIEQVKDLDFIPKAGCP